MRTFNYKDIFLIQTAIIAAVYNVLVFVIPFRRGGGFWSGYGFTMLMFAVLAGIGFYALGREGVKGKFYAIPLVSVAKKFLILQIIVGLSQMLFQFIPAHYGIALNTVFLGICVAKLITVGTAKKIIERIDEKVGEKVFYIKSMQVDVEGMVGKTSDEILKKALKNLAETIRYSDPMSNPQLAAVENKIEGKIAILAETIERADNDASKTLCDELQQLLAERNRKNKLLK